MSPTTEKMIKKEPEKYKYVFRTCFNSIYLVEYLAGTLSQINKEFGFNKVFVLHQDVAWARAGANIMKKVFFDKAGWEVLGMEAYPTGSTDFSSALMKARQKGARPQAGCI